MKLFWINVFVFMFAFANAQTVKIDGYAYETGNRGYLNQVEVEVMDKMTQRIITTVYSDIDGHFVAEVPGSKTYVLNITKELFENLALEVDVTTKTSFVKAEMKRAPGYIFEITLANKKEDNEIAVDAIKGALIEVYNNTTKKEVLALKDHPEPDFKVDLKKGNHYTILIRKEGYLAKRMEAFVNVKGCILCFEGVGQVQPGVSDNLTEGNEMGTLLANVELDRLFAGKKMEIENIYYDLNKANIRPDAAVELNKVITFLKDNPRLKIQMGSHTDSRGKDGSNMELSERRAKSAANYLINTGGLDRSRIFYRGYGETQIINKCTNGVKCSELEHQRNRRTELEILEIGEEEEFRSLLQMKKDEEMEALILELTNQEIVEVPADGNVPTDLKSTIEKENSIIEEETEAPVMEESVVEQVVEEQVMEEEPVFEDLAVEEETIIEQVEKPEVSEKIVEEKERFVKKIETTEVKKPAIQNTQELLNSELIDGHKIVIHFTNLALPKEHKIFSKHPNVVTYITQNKNILYLIGEFDSRDEAEKFLRTTVSSEYPNAYVASFEKGVRLRE